MSKSEKVRQRIYEIQSGHGNRDAQSKRVNITEHYNEDDEDLSDCGVQVPERTEDEPSPELEAILAVLDRGGEKVLSLRQRQAFQLVVREGRSLRVAGKLMGCSMQAVQEYVRDASKKLKKLCQPYL